jgi:hypothetical protein
VSNYWKKKLEELNQSDTNSSSRTTTSSDYWENKMTELEKEEKKKKEAEKTSSPINRNHGGGGGAFKHSGSGGKFLGPVKDRTWFQKGAFADGYDFGDVTKTILGTAKDVEEELIEGVLNIGENVVDAGAYIIGSVGGAFGANDFRDDMQNFIKKDLYDSEKVVKSMAPTYQLLAGIDDDVDKYSLLGKKSDDVVASGGQLLGAVGLQKIGIPWYVSMGLTTFGGESENALLQGATWNQAGVSATVSTAAELLSEKLFAGSGLGETGLISMGGLTAGIESKILKTLADFGLNVGTEAAEEVVTQFASNIGSAVYKEEDIQELLFSEEAIDGYIEAGIGGAVLGGSMNVGRLGNSIKTGRDYNTGLTDNEQAVVDKEYQNRLAEEEQSGKNLTKKDKAKIYNKVLEDMEKGYISTDTIEEVLGGDTYKTYRDTVDSEDALLKEFDELGKKQNATLAEQARYSELSQQIKELQANPQRRNYFKSKLSQEVSGLVSDDRLSESYNEKARRGQAYQADLAGYDTKQQAVIQKAIDSGILNNTRRTHEFVDMVAKISADKGVLFDFTDNAKLRDSGFAVDGKIVNGYVTKDGVTVNIDSTKSLNSVVGHEITHVLEGTEVYDALKQILFEYAKSRGEYQSRYDSLSNLYKNVKDADVEAELAADLVGDYLFTDADFINNLSTQHRNVFQKIYDEIKYLCKVATAGSKEARELEKVKKAFEKAYKEGGNVTGDTKYSMSDSEAMEQSINDLRSEIETINDDLTFAEGDEYRTLSNKLVKLNHELDKLLAQERKATKKTPLKTVLDNLSQYRRSDLESLAEQVSEGAWDGYEDLSRAELEDGIREIIEEMGYSPIEMQNAKHGLWVRPVESAKYSLSDSDGKQLSKEQHEYFKNSVVRDESGNLKVMYHGTSRGGFTVFDTFGSNYGLFGTGSYFTESKTIAESYTKKGKGKNPQVYETYLNITNPIDMDAAADPAAWAKALPDASFPDSGTNEDFYRAMEEYFEDMEYTRLEAAEVAVDTIMSMGYDGITHVGGGRVNTDGERHRVYIAFSPEQVKNVDNVKPTDSGDIRYSLSDSDGNKLTKEQAEYFKDSKMRDENGSLKVMYHGTPNGNFSVFKDGTYFTDNKEYADRYQNPSASSISSGKVATAPKTFEVYLDIKKPFDINDAEARNIYINDYIKGGNAIGINPYLSDAEYDKIKTIDWTEGEDLRDFLIENGYDYDGLVLDEGADGGYGDEVKSRGTSYVVFSPEQVKSIDNLKPTADPDIRFSLSEAVEESKDLLAVHNLTSEQLFKSMELGGLPMPSIAVLKADSVHDEYGDVSLILPKNAIDPKANKANKIYGGDAWTPVYPRIEYKPSGAVEKRISDKYYGLARDIGYDAVRPLYNYVTDLERQLNNAGGETAMLQKLYDDTDMMNLYLQDSGKGKIDPIEKETVTRISETEAAMNQFFIDALGEEVISSVWIQEGVKPAVHRKAFMEKNRTAIEETYKRYCMEEFKFTEEEAENVLVNTSERDLLTFVRNAARYIKNNGVTVKTEIDSQATQNAIREAAADGYKEWVDGLFKGVEEKTGIRNNQDYYTRSGNPRGWDVLHWANTLENVVKVMKGQEETGAGSMSPYNSFASLSHKRYGSIAEVKSDSDRLGKISQEEYEALGDSFAKRFAAIADSIKDPAERNQFIAVDNATETIVEAVRTQKSKAGILNYLQKWSKGATEQTVDDIVSLVNDIANMPTGYFEAKPQRAVGFDEVGVFVIPRNADIKLKQELLNRGYSIAEYDPDVEGDRQKVVNQFEEYKFSLSNVGEQPKRYGNYNVSGKDIALEAAPVAETKTPVSQTISEKESVASVAEVTDMFPDTPMQSIEELMAEAQDIIGAMEAYEAVGNRARAEQLLPEYEAVMEKIGQLEEAERQRADSLTEADIPPEMDAPYYSESQPVQVENPFEDRDWYDIGNRKVKAYMYENPEVKPFFQEEALNLLGELNDTQKGERWYNDELYYESGGEKGFGGVKRHTSASIEELLDQWGMSYADIEKGLNAIIEDNGAENIAAAKKLEFMLNDRLLHGYKDFYTNGHIPPNQDYINLLNEKQITEYSKEAFDAFMANADQYAPPASEEIVPHAGSDIAPVAGVPPVFSEVNTEQKNVLQGQQTMFEGAEPIRPRQEKKPRMARATPEEQARAQVLTDEPKVNRKKPTAWNLFKDIFVDKGTIFETLSLKTGNRELQGRWKSIGRAESSAQWFMEHGNGGTSSLKSIRDTVEKSGKTQQFYRYLYHQHNVDRMNLADRYEDVENKPVFGYEVTSEMSKKEAAKLEAANPEFKEWAKEVYDYMTYLREMMVDSGVISQDTANLWAEMYPHYVPIRRMGDEGLNINVALDTNRTGINAPVKRATGGNRDILPLFDTMAMRTEQTFKAVARNRFGVELKNMLGTTIENEAVDIDEAIDSVETELLQEGKDGRNPTFTVFENGEKVTFEITDEMYDTMKPKSEAMGYTNKVLNTVNNIRRGLLTEYNPAFMLTNPIKDTQDVLMNSQHPARTYANYPKAIAELIGKGQYYLEYMEHGGEQNTYFDGEKKTFVKEKSGLSKLIGFPLEKISQINNFIERVPRMAEYIASRKEGRSIDVSMLDAARVTTDFSAGGDLVKFANRNGFTFLNASVQGAVQQVRNVREAKAEGLKGWAKLAAKVAVAGLPSVLLNHLLWDDDEDYAELSDYVKQNYYVVGKYGDGKFVRIPKGRTLAVIQNAFEQIDNLVTGNDEVDLSTFGELVISNLAPNNPLENNLIAPITQAIGNETWYGEDLVPTRLQDLPTEEQYDETTDSISKWLGEHTPISPYKWNYILDQYSGAIGDVFLPMITPEAERGDDTIGGNMIAPITDKFTTDGVMKNQNISDFYDKKDELTTNAKASGATDEDVLMNMYMNAINSELSELYAEKRKIQSSDLSNAEKYEAVRDIQKQIVDLAKEGLSSYENISYEGDGEYAIIGGRYFQWYEPETGDPYWRKMTESQVTKYNLTKSAGNAHYVTDGNVHYRLDEDGKWTKISDKQLERQKEVTEALGITPDEYWRKTDISFLPMSDGEYEYAYDNPENYAVAKAVGGYDAYKGYSKELYDIKADKDENGKSISGSRKEKVLDYINNLDADYGEKIILFKKEYPSDDTYNYEIIDYLNSREDISYEEMETILKELGFDVSEDGTITWD